MSDNDIDVSKIINKIESSNLKHIDSFMLSNLVKLVHQLGLKKGQVLKLKIKDVVDSSGKVFDQINIDDRKIPVHLEVQRLIGGHIDHLKANENYNADEESLLFQNKKGTKYSEATRQLRKNFNLERLNEIRKNGIKKHYDFLKNLSDGKRMEEMEKFAGLSNKHLIGIINDRMQKAGRKKAPYEKKSYMDEIIDRLQNENTINVSELIAIPEKLNEFDLDDMSKVERLKNAFFNAVDRNKALNKNVEGIDEETKANSKRILKDWLLEGFCRENVTFDPNTGKPRKECQPKEDREPMTFHELITGEPFPTRTHITSTLSNIQNDHNLASTDSESFNIKDKREKLKERMDQIFKFDIFTLLDNCNLNPLKSFVSQLLKILINQFPIEISDDKLSGKNIGIIQENFKILIEDKVKDISLHNIDKPFSNYENLVHYMAKENVPYDYERKDYEIYIIEREILLLIIGKSWFNFTKKERKEFYVGLCDSEYLDKFFLLMPVESRWTTKGFNYTLFRELFGSNSTAFLKIAALVVNSTYFYFYDKDIPIKLNEKHKMWRALFRDKIIKSMQSLPYSKAFMATLGCVSCISLLRQIEFFKDKGITLEDTQAFEINPKSIFLS